MLAGMRWRISRRWVGPVLIGSIVIVVVAAGAAAAFETDTVTSYWQGLFWAISLITTVGFVGEPPRTEAGTALAVALMVVGFMLLSMISAYLAANFVREDERPHEVAEESTEQAILASLMRLEARVASLERAVSARAPHPRPRMEEGHGEATGPSTGDVAGR
jgi:voltage-gated potassium channel